MKLDDRLREYYNSSTAYIKRMQKHSESDFETYITLISRYVEKAHNLLEIGCGSGVSTNLIAKSFSHLSCYGVDLSIIAINYARRTFQRPNLIYSIQDVKNLGFKDESFSIVCSYDCVEHIPDLQVALKEQMRVVEPGGYLIIKCPHHMSPFYTLFDILKFKHSYPFTKCWWDNFPRLMFEINHLLLGLRGKIQFVTRNPDLTDMKQVGSDSDAVNDMSLIDLVNFFKTRQWKMLNYAWPRFDKLSSLILSRTFPYLASIGIVVQKPFRR